MLNIFGVIKMLDVRLDKKTELRLGRLCKETGHSKSYYAKKALHEFPDDKEDYLLGLSILEKQEPTISLRELGKELR
jgi:RHH-type transcriptional regulator, rel operon repressor / antitoxin RelB